LSQALKAIEIRFSQSKAIAAYVESERIAAWINPGGYCRLGGGEELSHERLQNGCRSAGTGSAQNWAAKPIAASVHQWFSERTSAFCLTAQRNQQPFPL
jgi:hypothetical protein